MKEKITQKAFEDVVINYSDEIDWFLHRIVSLIRRQARGDKIDDLEFSSLHQDIEIFGTKRLIKAKEINK